MTMRFGISCDGGDVSVKGDDCTSTSKESVCGDEALLHDVAKITTKRVVKILFFIRLFSYGSLVT